MPRHRTIEFKKFFRKIDSEVPEQLGVHLIADNRGTHPDSPTRSWTPTDTIAGKHG